MPATSKAHQTDFLSNVWKKFPINYGAPPPIAKSPPSEFYQKAVSLMGMNLMLALQKSNQSIMSNLLYAIAVIFIIAWALGFFVYSLGSVVHILLVIAIIAILLRLIRGERV